MELKDIAKEIRDARENIILLYAFNGTGKTRLSREYKDITKDAQKNHTGVYYNAFSEDLFRWNNDEEHGNDKIRLEVVDSSLSPLYKFFGNEDPVREKLKIYQPKYDFKFKYLNDNQEEGIQYIWFFEKKDIGTEEDEIEWIKISRGEERIFIWCFFLALFEIEDFPDAHKDYIFIDDPVSSLDDANIYLTARTLFDLFEECVKKGKKVIVSTHHVGLFSLLCDWLNKGDNSSLFKEKVIQQNTKETEDGLVIKETIEEKNKYLIRILEKSDEGLLLRGKNNGTWLYHLLLLQLLKQAAQNDSLYLYHYGLLRQVLETIASFLGQGRIGSVLHEIGEPDDTADRINANTHKKVYDVQNAKLTADNKEIFERVLSSVINKYNFKL